MNDTFFDIGYILDCLLDPLLQFSVLFNYNTLDSVDVIECLIDLISVPLALVDQGFAPGALFVFDWGMD